MTDDNIHIFSGVHGMEELMIGPRVTDCGIKAFIQSHNITLLTEHLSALAVDSWEDIPLDSSEPCSLELQGLPLRRLCLLRTAISLTSFSELAAAAAFTHIETLILHDISFAFDSFGCGREHSCCLRVLAATAGMRALRELELSHCRWATAAALRGRAGALGDSLRILRIVGYLDLDMGTDSESSRAAVASALVEHCLRSLRLILELVDIN